MSDFSPLMHATILFAFRPYVFKNSGVCSRIFEDVPDYAVEVPSCERFLSGTRSNGNRVRSSFWKALLLLRISGGICVTVLSLGLGSVLSSAGRSP